jgi:ribosomal protein S18 acetylase RimI-like enzyme
MGLLNVLSAVPLSRLVGFIFSGGLRMRYSGDFMDDVHKRLVPYKHWYLMVLGVDPGFQGKGYASKLLKPMLERADREKLPCYLETNDEVDVTIYRHFGFKVLEESLIPKTTVKNWAMFREVNGSFE